MSQLPQPLREPKGRAIVAQQFLADRDVSGRAHPDVVQKAHILTVGGAKNVRGRRVTVQCAQQCAGLARVDGPQLRVWQGINVHGAVVEQPAFDGQTSADPDAGGDVAHCKTAFPVQARRSTFQPVPRFLRGTDQRAVMPAVEKIKGRRHHQVRIVRLAHSPVGLRPFLDRRQPPQSRQRIRHSMYKCGNNGRQSNQYSDRAPGMRHFRAEECDWKNTKKDMTCNTYVSLPMHCLWQSEHAELRQKIIWKVLCKQHPIEMLAVFGRCGGFLQFFALPLGLSDIWQVGFCTKNKRNTV